jgi:hypothetical protein
MGTSAQVAIWHHSKSAGSMGLLSRAKSRLIPPKRLPKAASSVPTLMGAFVATASSGIVRISAATLRPLRAARSLSARWVSSGKLRMMTLVVKAHSSAVRYQLHHIAESDSWTMVASKREPGGYEYS